MCVRIFFHLEFVPISYSKLNPWNRTYALLFKNRILPFRCLFYSMKTKFHIYKKKGLQKVVPNSELWFINDVNTLYIYVFRSLK